MGPKLDFTRGTHDTYEVTGYFSDVNLLTSINDGTRTVKIELDGTLKQAALDIGGAVNSPYIAHNRFVESGSVVNAGIGTTPLGIHTIRVTRVGGNTYHTGIEFIAQDTTDANTKVKIQIPAQTVVSYGKKFSLSATAQHYNPFAFAADGTTAVAIGNAGAHGKVSAGWSGTTANHFDSTLDTATSMGLTVWEKGGNYWRPVNGGRIVKWIDSSGAIKTSVNMMPPSASGYFSAGITPTGTNEPDSVNWPATYAPSFHTKSPDPTLAEVSRVFMFPEFGNGSANLGSNGALADASMLTSTGDNITFTLDDGSTSLTAKDWTNANTYYNRNSTSSRVWLTFIGTGLTMNTVTHGQFNIVQNLPYGSHIFAIEIAANQDNGDWKVDGQLIHSHQSGPGSHAIYNYNPKRDDSFTFFQPKKPPIPDDAVVIADYMLMADFVPVGSTDTRHISKGTRAVGVGRDFWLDRAGGSGTMMIAIPSAGDRIFGWDAHGDQMTARLPMFATNYVQRGYDSDNRTRLARDASTLLDDGTAGGGSAVTVTSGASYGTYAHLTTDLTLGLHNLGWNSHSTSTNANSNRVEIASPIHTSSHYQEFETPWLREFIGGDRNMEQTNLVVTADGKTWGNINRDMSHIGNLSLSVDCETDSWVHDNQTWTFEETRGHYGSHWGPELGNKDWAIATTKHICLREGIYNIHFYSLRQDNIGHMYFKRNGTAIGGLHHSSGDEYDVQTLTLCAYFMRGDIFEIFDQGHGALWSHLFITRQDNEHKEQKYLIK